ncbi:hypothetical protein HOG21_05505 [bacterium]|jgi:hypothetical protein|nr:hypothetical protein [bacterium]
MKDTIDLFITDFYNFLHNNAKVLMICLLVIIGIQYAGKGNLTANILSISLHVIGDVFMIMAQDKYTIKEDKSGTIYLILSNLFFMGVGMMAVYQSVDGKNWQYLIGNLTFWTATAYQIMNAWDIKYKNIVNYKTTTIVSVLIILIYIQFDLVYEHTWIQILGFSLLPIFVGMENTPKVFIGKVFSVGLLAFGTLIDLTVQFNTPGDVPAAAISAFFITLIAFFGFARNAPEYIKEVENEQVWTLKTLWLIERI